MLYQQHLSASIIIKTKIKETNIPIMAKYVFDKVKAELDQIDSINISLDGWSDAIMRSFNGYIAQGKFSLANIIFSVLFFIKWLKEFNRCRNIKNKILK